jgi:hypothetical protein
VNTTLMELKLPETRLPDESVVELFELLKVNRTMTSLTVPVVTQSKVQWKAVTDYLDSNFGSLERLSLYNLSNGFLRKRDPFDEGIVNSLTRNLHIRSFSLLDVFSVGL